MYIFIYIYKICSVCVQKLLYNIFGHNLDFTIYLNDFIFVLAILLLNIFHR